MTYAGFWLFRVFFLMMAAVIIVFSFTQMRSDQFLLGFAYLLFAGVPFCLITHAYWTLSYGQMTGILRFDPPNTPPPGWNWSRAVLITTVLITGGAVMVALVQEQVLVAIALFVLAWLVSWGVWRWLFWKKENTPSGIVGLQTAEPTHE